MKQNSYDPLKIEPGILKYWDENRIFKKRLAKNKGNPTFSFYEGPPTANNKFGVHHALGRTLKDLYLRYRAMKGFEQRRQGGFDAQGLWVEVEVEKALGLKNKHEILEYGLKKFANKCKSRVKHFIDTNWVPLSIKLGMWMDWENAYVTNTDENNEYVWLFLKTAHEKGMLYKGHRSMPWCGRCSCTMAQHEVHMGYKEVQHNTIYMKFPLKGSKNEYLLVWTTTPWTVSSNVSVAVHPNLEYAQVKQDSKIYWLSSNRLPILKGDYKVLKKVKGKELLGRKYEPPYYNLPVQKDIDHKIIAWKEVSDSEGTGLVHSAPGCGPEDFELAKKENLPIVSPLNEDAVFVDGFGWQTGREAQDVDKAASKDMEDRGFIYKYEKYTHNYPHCWRCKYPLVFRVVDQWFVSSKEIKKNMIKQSKEINWHPDWVGTKRMIPWLENMRDWAVSRTRYYGSPMPVWKCKECDHYDVIGSIDELKKRAISGLSQLKELHRPWIDEVVLNCPKCDSKMYRIEETGDVWMDAGVLPFSTLKYKTDKKYWNKWFPADLIVEMHEQVRGWFYAMAFIGNVLEKQTPYKNVLAHAMVLDETGREMHKSWGNAIDGQEGLEKMGADPMRWIYCTTRTGSDVRFGYGPAGKAKKSFNVLWNVVNYFNSRTGLKKTAKPKNLNVLDKWLLSRLESLKLKVTEELDSFNTSGAARAIENFYLEDVSRTYGQLVRDDMNNPKRKEVVNYVSYNVLLETLKLLAPFVPFVSEKIYLDNFKSQEKVASVHLFDWPKSNKRTMNSQLEKEMEIVKEVISTGLAAREKGGRTLRWPVKKVTVVSSMQKVSKAVKNHEGMLKKALNVLEVKATSKLLGVDYEVKLNYAKAGPEFGSNVSKLNKMLSEKPASKVISELKNNQLKLKVGPKSKLTLTGEYVTIREKLPKGVMGQQTKNFTLYLDTEETPDMIASGFAREVSRKVQDLRKHAGLSTQSKITLEILVTPKLRKVLESKLKYLSNKTRAKSIDFVSKLSGQEKDSFVVKDEQVKIAIRKA